MRQLRNTTTPQQTFDLDVPLHPNTDSGEDVAHLVRDILHGVEALTASDKITDKDVVQALTIATAVRAAIAEVSVRNGEPLHLDLHDVQLEGTRYN